MSIKRSVFITVAVAVFLLTTVTATLVTLILPKLYASKARIIVKDEAHYTPDPALPDPYFIATPFEVLQSELILDRVIDQLDLATKWAQKYHMEGKLSTAECRQLLKSRLELTPENRTNLIGIRVYSEDKNEAADTANAIARTYESRAHEMKSKALAEQQNLSKSGGRFDNTNSFDPRLMNDDPTTMITDLAVPSKRPARPNVPLNIFLGAVVGIFTGLAVGGVAAFLVGKLGRRKEAV